MECQLEGITLHYEVHGAGRPMVMIHGYGPDYRLMTGCMEPIFREHAGWQRIYLDLPGMGQTRAPGWLTNADQMLQVLKEFINRVIPGQRYAVAGQSYGGYLARGLVHRQPERVDGLCLICPVLVADKKKRTLPPRVTLVRDPGLDSRIAPDEAGSFKDFRGMAVVESQLIWERSLDEVYTGVWAADHEFLDRYAANGYSFSFDVDALPTPFTKPALFLMGRQDSIVGYADAWRIMDAYPRATLAVLDRAGHNLQIEQEGLFNALVGEWIGRME